MNGTLRPTSRFAVCKEVRWSRQRKGERVGSWKIRLLPCVGRRTDESAVRDSEQNVCYETAYSYRVKLYTESMYRTQPPLRINNCCCLVLPRCWRACKVVLEDQADVLWISPFVMCTESFLPSVPIYITHIYIENKTITNVWIYIHNLT